MEYLKRTADEHLSLLLASSGAVLIEGPKWCGKTTTAEQQANSTISLQDPDMRDKYQATIRVKPSLLLAGDTPRLIDEWQEAPVLWDSVRAMVDKRNEWRKRSIPTHSEWLYPLTFDAGKGLKEA